MMIKKLPRDSHFLRNLHAKNERYLARLNKDIAEIKAIIYAYCLYAEAEEPIDTSEFGDFEIPTRAPQWPSSLEEYFLLPESLHDEFESWTDPSEEVGKLSLDSREHPSVFIEVYSCRLPLLSLLHDTFRDIHRRLEDAIAAVSEGTPIQHWPDKPALKLSTKQRLLFDAVWEIADWSRQPFKARFDLVEERVYGGPCGGRAIVQLQTDLNKKMSDQEAPYSLHRDGDFFEIAVLTK